VSCFLIFYFHVKLFYFHAKKRSPAQKFLEFRGTAFQKRKNINKNPHKKSIAPWFPIAPPMQNHENRFQNVGMVAKMQVMQPPHFCEESVT